MIDSKEKQILVHLRNNARMPISEISKRTGLPISTVFERLKKLKKSSIIKFTSLMDFSKLNYNLRINFSIKINRTDMDNMLSFLGQNKNINSIRKIKNGYNLLIEAYFKDMKEFIEFDEKLREFNYEKRSDFHIIDTIKEEEFLTVI